MFTKIRITMKKLITDTLGEDLSDVSSGLSKGAKVVLTCSAITAAAAGGTALSNSANNASDTAASKINKTIGAQSVGTPESTTPFQGK